MGETAPTIVRREEPEWEVWDSPERGRVRFRTLIDGAAGPTAGLVQGLAEIEPGDHEGRHRHTLPQVAHVLSGRGEASLGDRTVPIEAGDTVFIPAGVTHGWRAGDVPLRFLYTFPADRFADVSYTFEGDG